MFVRINNQRIKISSIGRYKDLGKTSSTKKYVIAIKISNVWEHFYFDTEEEKENILLGLDTVLKTAALRYKYYLKKKRFKYIVQMI